MDLPTQKGLINKKPSFFKDKYILFTETYGDDIGMGSFKVHHWKKEDKEIYLYDKDDDRYCTLSYAKSYMLATSTGKLTDEIKKT